MHEPRRSAKIATVAELMECSIGDIYRLIRKGELEVHGKGTRGVRVFLDSVAAYQQRETKHVVPPRIKPAVVRFK